MTTSATVTVPAHAEYSSVLGLVADAIAAVADVDADRIDDLGLAIEEVADALTIPGTTELIMRVWIEKPNLFCDISASGPTDAGGPPLDEVGSSILSAVVDEIDVDRSGRRIRLRVADRATGFNPLAPG